MPPLYHYKKNKSKVEEIKHYNLPLGAMKNENYKSIEIKLNKGDVLVMMSDGFPELHNNQMSCMDMKGLLLQSKKLQKKNRKKLYNILKMKLIVGQKIKNLKTI